MTTLTYCIANMNYVKALQGDKRLEGNTIPELLQNKYS